MSLNDIYLVGAGWTAFRLQRLGMWNTGNTAMFPRTTEIIKSLNIPLAVRGVMFAKQTPSSGSLSSSSSSSPSLFFFLDSYSYAIRPIGVKPHSDGRNFILTCHLGLKVPKYCWIAVGGERRGWKENKVLSLLLFLRDT